jgi:hemoglobin
LFFKQKYKGKPKLAHQRVGKPFDGSIEKKHFGCWLIFWFRSIDYYFEGKLAVRAKDNARKMASHIFMSIYMVRNTIC